MRVDVLFHLRGSIHWF